MSSKVKKSLLLLSINVTPEKTHKSPHLEGFSMKEVKKPVVKSKEKLSEKEILKTSTTVNKKDISNPPLKREEMIKPLYVTDYNSFCNLSFDVKETNKPT